MAVHSRTEVLCSGISSGASISEEVKVVVTPSQALLPMCQNCDPVCSKCALQKRSHSSGTDSMEPKSDASRLIMLANKLVGKSMSSSGSGSKSTSGSGAKKNGKKNTNISETTIKSDKSYGSANDGDDELSTESMQYLFRGLLGDLKTDSKVKNDRIAEENTRSKNHSKIEEDVSSDSVSKGELFSRLLNTKEVI